MKNNVRHVTKTIEQDWLAVTGPIDCACGHTHHGRDLYEHGRITNLATQYGMCDEETCSCTTLVVTPRAPRQRQGGDR